MVESLLRLTYFYSARILWPVHALPRMYRLDVACDRHAFSMARPSMSDLELAGLLWPTTSGVEQFALWVMPQQCLCGAMLKHFRHEFEALIRNKGSQAAASA